MSTLTPRLDKLDKNYLINGGMDFFQRSTASVAIGGSFAYQTADRWQVGYNSGGGITSQTSQRSTIVPDSDVKYSIRLSANAPSSAGSLLLRQRIEAANARDLVNKTISLSFYVRSESCSQMTLDINVPTAEDNFTSTTAVGTTITKTLTVSTSWQLVTFENIAIPISAAAGLEIRVGLQNFTVTGSIKDHYITKAMLAVSTKASTFCRAGKTIGEELAYCQRYFEIVTGTIIGSGFSLTTTTASGLWPFIVCKRVAPAISTSGGTFRYNNGTNNYNATTVTPIASNTVIAAITLSGMSGISSGNIPGSFDINGSGSLFADAEI